MALLPRVCVVSLVNGFLFDFSQQPFFRSLSFSHVQVSSTHAPHRTAPQTVRCAHCGMFVSNPQSLFSTHLALVAGIVSCLVLLWLRSANMRLHAALLRMPVAISIVIFDCLFICILIPTLATHQCSCAEMHFTSYYRLFLQQQLLKEENCSQHSVMGFYF